MGGDNDNRNLILAAVLAMLVVFTWQAFVTPPPPPPEPAAEQGAEGQPPTAPAVPGATTTDGTPDGTARPAAPPGAPVSRAEAIAADPRVPIETPSVTGSIRLTGGRLDDLHLSRYRETLEPDADTVILLNPAGAADPYFIDYGWRRTVNQDPGPLPSPTTEWQVESGETLTPATPVVLRWDNGQGLIFRRTFEIDDRYMVTVTQSVENTTGAAVSLAPYGAIARRGEPEGVNFYILHEGAVGMFDGTLSEVDYDEMRDLDVIEAERGPARITQVQNDGWLGFTDKYWMSTLIAEPGQAFDAVYRSVDLGVVEEFRTEMRLPVLSVPAGGRVESISNLFSGAKEVSTIRHYEETLGIDGFVDSVDWGWFYFLTKPMFSLLMWVHSFVGNMGMAIIGLTFVVKAILFPLAYKSFVAMSKMKKLQPEMERIKEQSGDDRQKLQQEMMALYKKEKVNPAAGCLPILLQIPIFFALYKVLFVTIEMRHAPFVGWIEDLSAPDPSTWMNLFGLLPYEVNPYLPGILMPLSIGVYPIMLGVTMWLQQKLNPAPADQTQRMIFAWMPWVFMFLLGQFASGLVLYWCANNVLTFAQQYLIMRSQGIEVDLLGNIKSGIKPKRGGKAKAAKAGQDEGGTGEGGTEETGAGEAETEGGAGAPVDEPEGEKPEPSSPPAGKKPAAKPARKSGSRSGAKPSGRSGQRGGRKRSGGRG